ncbi:MAG TPA: BTAD domain-containing putative transcriptional regulator [Microlunatus sp.]
MLGPLVVEHAGDSIPVPGGRQRALLIALLLRVGKVVPSERLIDDIWAANPPADPTHALQQVMSRLRRVLFGRGAAEDWLVWHPSGYQLAVDPGVVDVTQFEQLVELGRRHLAAGAPVEAAEILRRALGLWRGPALIDVADLPFGQAAAVDLAERKLAATEDRIEADLLRGEHAAVLVELEALVSQHRLRERLSAQLMRALYADARQADALNLYESTRRMLADDLGVDPGPQLRMVYEQILVHHPNLVPPPAEPHGLSDARPSNLPAAVTTFVARDGDVGRVLALLEVSRLVTLTGPGGVGKTRLALHAANQLVETVADGVWWVDLTPLGEPMQLADAILRALEDQPGGRLAAPRVAGAEPEEQLRSFLSDRDLVLVLDNAEHLAEAVGHLVGGILTRAPGLRILATSQRPLNTAGEAVWSVPPLPVPPPDEDLSTGAMLDYPSVQLFADRAAAAGGIRDTAEDDTAAVAEICRTLDGMPLAIELAAARTRLLPPHQLLARLNDRFSLLTTRSGSAPARQRSLRAVVEWSHRMLTEPERVLLRRLAVFVGGARLDAVEQVCATPGNPVAGGITSDEIVDLLAGLIDKSLISVSAADGEARYTMLETIRAIATEQLAEAGEDTPLRAAHARYYGDLAVASVRQLRGPEQLRWLQRLSAERANMRAAIEYASGHGDGETALRLAAALSQFWWLTGDVSESHRLAALALHAVGPALSPDRAAVLTFLAWLDLSQESTPEQVRVLEEVVEYCHSISDHDGAALSTALLALAVRQQGDRPRSRELAAQATAASSWPQAVALMLSGGTAGMNGDVLQGEQQITTALVRFRLVGDRWGQAECMYLLGGGLANIHGRYEHALQTLDEGVELATQLGNTEQIIGMLAITGNILVLTGDYPGAQERHEEALRLAHRLSLPSEIAFIRNGMGLCARRQGDSRLARAHHEHALAIYERGRLLSGAAVTYAWLGYTAELDGDADLAQVHHLRSLALARQSGDPRAIALPLEGLAGVAVLRADYQRCSTLLGAATAIRASVGAPLPAAERVDVDRAAGAARAHLHDSAFMLACDQGAGMNMDAACAFATINSPS